MIINTKGLALFFVSVFAFGLVFSFIPTQAYATASGYVCSGDSSYDPREGSNYNGISDSTVYAARKAQYITDYKHEWGICKNGSPAVVPTTAFEKCNKGFLGFPTWYRGLTMDGGSCDIKSPSDDLGGFIWHIALNVIEMAMMAVVYVAVFFILYGGFQFLTSQGAPDGMAKARTTILNAVIGLVISLVAVGIINFIVTGLLI